MEKGKSVGAIITNREGEYLVQYRLNKPIGLAMVAGHVDEGESPEAAIRREVEEETGLKVESVGNQALHRSFANPCAKGHTSHEWWVYFVATSGVPELKEPAKHKFVKWMGLAELRDYAKRHVLDPKQYPFDPAWFKHILPAFDII